MSFIDPRGKLIDDILSFLPINRMEDVILLVSSGVSYWT